MLKIVRKRDDNLSDELHNKAIHNKKVKEKKNIIKEFFQRAFLAGGNNVG